MSMTKNRVHIPAELRRTLKIECGYMCSVPHCPNAIGLEFHHINEDPSDNRPENIIVLCAIHHSQTITKVIDRKACNIMKEQLRRSTPPIDHVELARLISENLKTDSNIPDAYGEKAQSLEELAATVEAELGLKVEIIGQIGTRLVVWLKLPLSRISQLKYLLLGTACILSGYPGTEVIEVGPSNTHEANHACIVPHIGIFRFIFDATTAHETAQSKISGPRFWRSARVMICRDPNFLQQSFSTITFNEFESRAQ